MDRALMLRERLLNAQGCSFDATITADYDDYRHTFVLRCSADAAGVIQFEVLAPDTISGISGFMDEKQGKLTFDDEILAFYPLADGQIAPVTAPWIVYHTLRSGYITACGEMGGNLLLSIDDSYADDALRLEIRLDDRDFPISAEIIWQGRRIVSVLLENFELL